MRGFFAILAVIVASSSASSIGTRPRGHADTYFACENGFTFEASGSAARCRRAATVLSVPLVECPLTNGATLTERVDQTGAKDMCVGTSGPAAVALERSCPSEYTKRVVTGPDRCERPTPEAIRAPSVPVVR
jgi:hypothetical protein